MRKKNTLIKKKCLRRVTQRHVSIDAYRHVSISARGSGLTTLFGHNKHHKSVYVSIICLNSLSSSRATTHPDIALNVNPA